MRRRDENTDARLNNQDEPWTAVPNRLLKDARLSRSARLLYCVLLMFADDSGQAFPSQRRLARALGRMTANGADGASDIVAQRAALAARIARRRLADLAAFFHRRERLHADHGV